MQRECQVVLTKTERKQLLELLLGDSLGTHRL